MKTVLLIGLLLIGSAASAQSRDLNEYLSYGKSGNEFVRICDGRDTPQMVIALCATYADGMMAGIGATTSEPHMFCAPDGITNGQEMQVLIQFIKTHPANAQLPPAILFKDALKSAWPCDKGKP